MGKRVSPGPQEEAWVSRERTEALRSCPALAFTPDSMALALTRSPSSCSWE